MQPLKPNEQIKGCDMQPEISEGSLKRLVRRDVLERALAALESAVDDAMSYGPSEADADYLAAIAEAKAELQAPNDQAQRPHD